jgi:hypothetical protein
MPRELDEPSILESTPHERVQELCRLLAHSRTSMLPQRHRARWSQMFARGHAIQWERMLHRDRVRLAREEEDARGESS